MDVDEMIGLGGVEPSAEIEINVQNLSEGGEEAESQLPRPFHRLPPSEIASIGEHGTRSIFGSGLLPPAELPMLVEGGDGENGGPPPAHAYPLSERVIHHHAYISVPAILGTCIHILAGIMDKTTENKKLIGVSVISLMGNVVVCTWLNLHGVNFPIDDWKNISCKIVFVFTGTLTFYASFSTLSARWFTLPGIVLCGALAVRVLKRRSFNKVT